MATYGELRDRVLRMLEDPEGAGYSEELLLDAISAAHDAILPWFPKLGTAELAGDGSLTEFTLPADLYEVDAVVIRSTGEILPRSSLVPGNYIGDNSTGTNDWLLFPTGSISFSKAPSAEVDLYYTAQWLKPDENTENDTDLEPPDFAMTGMSLYATAFAILPSAVTITEIRQFGTKVDSGNPEHNPRQKAVDKLIQLFVAEMNRHPKYQRAQQ